ncbi:signal transduction histidine kinase regulating citrate/malate metabolism [Alkaliphilus metalliredigens QYMF]|uniref:Signal transduction histidine kinase regulating citrate/malate metabolism n=1 Tax=Alkaliphilus metalliredigens (strain QYMF) TaxID=293826 RepID=A6TKX7_ALKMQ|nr:GHKL domain-containing protein [Alkaliphilus metalliredigens]ABR46845.1 signal transduction histidine kinase regulating citrate/malate metabolism [Alkaliphilus metalliredigens QYMF]
MNIIANLITNTIDIFLLYLFISYTVNNMKFRPIEPKDMYKLLFLIAFNTTINQFLGLANLVGYILVLFTMSYTLSLIFNRSYLNIALIFLYGLALLFLSELIVVYGIALIFNVDPSEMLMLNTYRILAIILAKFISFMVIHKWTERMPLLESIKNKKQLPLVLMFLFNTIIIYLVFVFYRYLEGSLAISKILLFSVICAVLLFNWLSYILTRKVVYQEQQEELMKLKVREYENQSLYLKNAEELIEGIRSQRHDLNNYIGTLYGLLSLNKIETAKQYIESIEEEFSSVNEIIDIGHPIIMVLVDLKREKARREKISFDIDIDVPRNLTIDDIDLSIVLSNVLDNAIEACISSNSFNMTIDLKMYVNEGYLIIKIVNTKSPSYSINEESIEQSFTTKPDKSNHGIGLRNIKKVIVQNNGYIKLNDKGTVMEIQIALPQIER